MVLKLLCTYGNQLNNLWKEFYILEENKKCTKCGEIKPVSEFYWRKDHNKYRNECRICLNKQRLKKYFANHEEKLKQRKQHRKDNHVKYLTQSRKRWVEQKEQLLVWDKNWKENNPNRRKEINNKANKKRRGTIQGKINHSFSGNMRRSLKGNKKGGSWEFLIGYSVKDLIHHLEKQFTKGMNWGNYGKWHIDHIIPISLWEFNSYNNREFKQCWSLCNLQPLWATDNISKKDKIV